MRLRWNNQQTDIYNLIQNGVTNKDLRDRGYKGSLARKVRAAIDKGDAPQKPPSEPKQSPAGEPLFSATLKTKRVSLDPIVAMRYDSVRHALGWGNDYSLEQFLDEATDIVAELVGAVPPGFVKEEEKEVTAV